MRTASSDRLLEKRARCPDTFAGDVFPADQSRLVPARRRNGAQAASLPGTLKARRMPGTDTYGLSQRPRQFFAVPFHVCNLGDKRPLAEFCIRDVALASVLLPTTLELGTGEGLFCIEIQEPYEQCLDFISRLVQFNRRITGTWEPKELR